MSTLDNNTKITYEEAQAIDTLVEFMLNNETVANYIEGLIEATGIEVSQAVTETEMETYLQIQSNFQIKLLAKVIGVL